ncbi:hypothetical protein KBD61_02520 [Patescibacteria group bacterium]|nr:hypothetical protein [Patescibacteria group bacterium]MBP9709880.1 hypothetical protein [Patescibacteria group bacterium]
MEHGTPRAVSKVTEKKPLGPEEIAARREAATGLLRIAESFDGSKGAEKALFEGLIALEKAIVARLQEHGVNYKALAFNERETHEIALAQEIKTATDADDTKPKTIHDLLGLAGKAFHYRLGERLDADPEADHYEEKQNIHVVHLDQIILPSEEGEETPTIVKGEGTFEKPRFHERLQELYALLRKEKVFVEEVLVVIGKRDPRMMRKVSYALVLIPRLQASILVCDQIGEATFVIHDLLATQQAIHWSKRRLLAEFPDKMERIVYRTSAQWQEELHAALFPSTGTTTEGSAKATHVDTRQMEIRERIKEDLRRQFPTPELFLSQTAAQVQKLNSTVGKRRGTVGICKELGLPIDTDPGSIRSQLRIAEELYGSDHPTVFEFHEALRKQNDREEIIKELLRRCPTSRDLLSWSRYTWIELALFRTLNGQEIKRVAIMKTLGLNNVDPAWRRRDMLTVAETVYGSDDLFVREQKELTEHAESPAWLRTLITALYPDPGQYYRALVRDEKILIKVGSSEETVGAKALKTVFGVAGDIDNAEHRLALVATIYGAETPVLQELLRVHQLRRSPEGMRQEVLKEYPDATTFFREVRKNWSRRFAEAGDQAGLTLPEIYALITHRRINTEDTLENRLRVANCLFGANDPIMQTWNKVYEARINPVLLAEEFRQKIPTREQWLGEHLERLYEQVFAVNPLGEGIGLHAALATFGYTLKNTMTRAERERFGNWFYRDPAIVQKELTDTQARRGADRQETISLHQAAIKKAYPDPLLFLSTNSRELLDRKFELGTNESKVSYAALIKGLRGDHWTLVSEEERQWSIAEEVYGNDNSMVQAWKRALTIRSSPELMREEVKRLYPTANDFIHAKFNGSPFAPTPDGKGISLKIVARLYGKIETALDKEDVLQLAGSIYGQDDPTVVAWDECIERRKDPSIIRNELRTLYATEETFIKALTNNQLSPEICKDPDGNGIGWILICQTLQVPNFERSLKREHKEYLVQLLYHSSS